MVCQRSPHSRQRFFQDRANGVLPDVREKLPTFHRGFEASDGDKVSEAKDGGFSKDFTVISWDLMVMYCILIGFHLMGFYGDLMGFNGDVLHFN